MKVFSAGTSPASVVVIAIFLGMTLQPLAAQTVTGNGAGVPLGELPAAQAEGGMIVYIDPRTGDILGQPAPGTQALQLTPELQNAFSTSHAGFVALPSTTPGGGVKLDLRGRFQSPFIAVIGAEGTATVRHLDELPRPGDKP